MRTTSPRQLALYVSFIIAIVSTGLLILYRQIQFSNFLLPITGSFIIVYSITYLVSYFTINNFIFEKINPVYKTIENIALTKEGLR